MKDGVILRAARDSAKSTVNLAIVFIVLCLIVLGFNWRYVYNLFSGPVPLTGALATNPGAREFVTVEGKLIPTGATQQTTLKFKGLKIDESKSADYMMLALDGRFVVVKVPANFTGNTVQGRLEELPEELKSTPLFYPWMVVEIDYRIHTNLFVWLTALVLPLALLLLAFGLWRVAKPENTWAIRRLKSYGSPHLVMAAIDAELSAQGCPGRVLPITFAPSWVIVWEPCLVIFPRNEIAGITLERRVKASDSKTTVKHVINFKVKGRNLAAEVEVKEADAARVMQYVREQYPDTVDQTNA